MALLLVAYSDTAYPRRERFEVGFVLCSRRWDGKPTVLELSFTTGLAGKVTVCLERALFHGPKSTLFSYTRAFDWRSGTEPRAQHGCTNNCL